MSELRRLRDASPHLAAAIDFQIELQGMHRRAISRMALPRTFGNDGLLQSRLNDGQRLIEFDDLVLDWTEVRRLLRDSSELLRRFEMVESHGVDSLLAKVRDGGAAQELLRAWYDEPLAPRQGVLTQESDEDAAAKAGAVEAGPIEAGPIEAGPIEAGPIEVGPIEVGTAQVCLMTLRPHLMRCADALNARVEAAHRDRPACAVCGGEPDFTRWSVDGRRLICARCTAQWRYRDEACPFCLSTRTGARRSFRGERYYRVDVCDDCQRYLKGFDEQTAGRPLMLVVDTIATLPLDAAAMQMGYR